MKHTLLKNKIDSLEKQIFECDKCKELFDLRQSKQHNCPVLGFSFDNYVNAKVCSVCEAPGVYKPHKGEILIEKLEDFHNVYDRRIQDIALIGKRLMSIFSKVDLNWTDIQHFNVVCCSPPDYRKPNIEEVVNCLPFLQQRIKLMQNLKVILAFGKVAKSAISKGNFNVPIIKTHHPSYIYSYMSNKDREVEIESIIKQFSLLNIK